MANHYVAALAQGAMYSSYKEFQIALAAFCRETNSRFTIYDCKAIETFNNRRLICDRLPLHLKYKYAKVACERFGQPRHEGKGIRNKESKKNGCGAHMTLSARKTERETFLIVLRMVTKHSNQCEIRRKQKRIKMTLQKSNKAKAKPASAGPPDNYQNASPNVSFQVKQEPVDNDDDNSMQEYNYPVKPMVVYSDDENEEQKPIPIFHLSENQLPSERAEDMQAPADNEENTSEDVNPPAPADKPSLRALLLPAMALNFSQRAIHTET